MAEYWAWPWVPLDWSAGDCRAFLRRAAPELIPECKGRRPAVLRAVCADVIVRQRESGYLVGRLNASRAMAEYARLAAPPKPEVSWPHGRMTAARHAELVAARAAKALQGARDRADEWARDRALKDLHDMRGRWARDAHLAESAPKPKPRPAAQPAQAKQAPQVQPEPCEVVPAIQARKKPCPVCGEGVGTVHQCCTCPGGCEVYAQGAAEVARLFGTRSVNGKLLAQPRCFKHRGVKASDPKPEGVRHAARA